MEIKFRGKRKDNGKWTSGYLFKIWETTSILWGTTNGIPNMVEVLPETVGQHTGLKDNNGVEIYKDDKLLITDEYGEESIHTVVYFADEDYPAYDLEPQLNCDSNGLSHAMACCEIEVIGNIHKEVSQ